MDKSKINEGKVICDSNYDAEKNECKMGF